MRKLYAAYIALIDMAKSTPFIDYDVAVKMQVAHAKQFTSRDDDLNELVTSAESELYAIAERANNGEMTEDEFKREYLAALLLLLQRAAAMGGDAGEFGALPQNARVEIDRLYTTQVNNLDNLARDIYSGRYQARDTAQPGRPVQNEEQGKSKLLNRIVLWSVAIAAAVGIGKLHTSEVLMWVYGPTEHCDDCTRLNGQVHTREEWLASPWRPQGSNLQCGGWNCQCTLSPMPADTPTRGNF